MACYCRDNLKIDWEKLNIRGGAIALGHPLGCTGTRQIVTGLSECRRRKSKILLTSMCIGTGQGMAGKSDINSIWWLRLQLTTLFSQVCLSMSNCRFVLAIHEPCSCVHSARRLPLSQATRGVSLIFSYDPHVACIRPQYGRCGGRSRPPQLMYYESVGVLPTAFRPSFSR